MKKALLILPVFVLFASFCFAQNINQIDAQGRKQGTWEKTYGNGALRYKGQFKNNHPYGVFKYYFPMGNLSAISVYSDDGAVSHTKTYHLNGKLMAEGKFVNKKKDSVWNFYNSSSGKLVAKESYSNGIKNGKSVVYYPSTEKPAEIIQYKNGVKDGEWFKYFPNDSIYIHGLYHDDTLEGFYKVYDISGRLHIKGDYLNGLQNGNWITYDSTGKVLNKQIFSKGKLIKQTR